MENPLKQFLYAGIGLASLTTEKVQSTLDELVEKGKISDSEAKKVAEDVIANLNGKREDFEDKLSGVVKNVAEKLNIDGILDAIVLANQTLTRAGYNNPRIAVAALNPHAGDGGAIGTEEIEIIAPAVEKAKLQSIKVDGPFPSDTLYLKVRDGQFDCAVSMYHDQGQIAIKLLGFDQGVSVLAGLPVPIATPAHGTAFDIVGTNSANVNAALNAFRMVSAMAQGRNFSTRDQA